MENEYIKEKEIERLKQQVEDLQDQIAIKNGLLEVAQSGILGHGEREEIQAECKKWESNYIVERDNAEVLRAELDKYRWVPVDEAMPPVGEPVLVCWDDDIEPEIDYTDVEVDFGTEYFVNSTPHDPAYWARIPDIPSDKNPGID